MICEIRNVNSYTVEHINCFTLIFTFSASILNSVCLKVCYQLSSWSTQFPRKAAFVFKTYLSVHSVFYACTDQDFHLYLRASSSFSSSTF